MHRSYIYPIILCSVCLCGAAQAAILNTAANPAAVTQTATLYAQKDSLFVLSDPNSSYGQVSFQLVGGTTSGLNAIALNLAPVVGDQLLSITVTMILQDNIASGLRGTISFGHYNNWDESTTYNGLVAGQTFMPDGTLSYATSTFNGHSTLTFTGQDLLTATMLANNTGVNPGFFWQATDLVSIEPFGGFTFSKDGNTALQEFATVTYVVPEPSAGMFLWAASGALLSSFVGRRLRGRVA